MKNIIGFTLAGIVGAFGIGAAVYSDHRYKMCLKVTDEALDDYEKEISRLNKIIKRQRVLLKANKTAREADNAIRATKEKISQDRMLRTLEKWGACMDHIASLQPGLKDEMLQFLDTYELSH